MGKKEVVKYIISFLQGNACLPNDLKIDYVRPEMLSESEASIIIVDSGFFESLSSITTKPFHLPLQKFQGIPILFGEPFLEKRGSKSILHADLVASSFFFLSRFEERTDWCVRDEHGRIKGKDSLLGKIGFLENPIVDQYSLILRRIIIQAGFIIQEHANSFRKIYLTHDIDVPWEHFTLRTAIKRIAGDLIKRHRLNFYPFLNWLGFPEFDPIYTFPRLFDLDSRIPSAIKLYFAKSGGQKSPEDSHIYVNTKAFKRLAKRIIRTNGQIGYHASYSAGLDPTLIAEEKNLLESTIGARVTYGRNHYLLSLRPEDFDFLITAGITDDFTMGYADTVGFRLGTCRSVNWINPIKLEVTSLILHPLTAMEGTLFGPQYMNLSFLDAKQHLKHMIDVTHQFRGDVTLLWHNTSFANQRESELYSLSIGYLSEFIKGDKFLDN